MNDWTAVWLGVIAASTLVMALIQIGAIIFGARAVHRLQVTLGRLEQDVKPILERAQQVSSDATRMSALATAQVERADRVFADLALRIEQTAALIQQALIAPAREGAAFLSALRATINAIRGLRGNGSTSPPREVGEDEALFIG